MLSCPLDFHAAALKDYNSWFNRGAQNKAEQTAETHGLMIELMTLSGAPDISCKLA